RPPPHPPGERGERTRATTGLHPGFALAGPRATTRRPLAPRWRMLVRLLVLAGPDRGRAVSMSVFPIVIGRGRDTDTCLNDPYVSRAHCRIEMRGSDLTLVDLGSSSGTFVNDKRIS